MMFYAIKMTISTTIIKILEHNITITKKMHPITINPSRKHLGKGSLITAEF